MAHTNIPNAIIDVSIHFTYPAYSIYTPTTAGPTTGRPTKRLTKRPTFVLRSSRVWLLSAFIRNTALDISVHPVYGLYAPTTKRPTKRLTFVLRSSHVWLLSVFIPTSQDAPPQHPASDHSQYHPKQGSPINQHVSY